MRGRALIFFVILPAVLVVAALTWFFTRGSNRGTTPAPQPAAAAAPASSAQTAAGSGSSAGYTNVYAHNLMLRKGPDFRIYVRWLRGRLTPTRKNVIPSFDDTESFYIDVDNGVIRANLGDLGHFLNANVGNAPLRNISLSGDGEQVKISGTLHKGIPLPISLEGTIAVLPVNRVQLHVTKLSVLKVPVKGLLGLFKVKVDDLFKGGGIPGISVTGNDIVFDTQQLLPPPHIRGQLTKVRIANPDLEEIYGEAKQDLERTEQWRNFLRLRDGRIDFGKLTMNNVDLVMIDISKDAWFDLDLSHYQEQLVNGYTHMTPEAGLQIFMPDLDELPKTKANQNISMQWMKNRNMAPPPEVYATGPSSNRPSSAR